MNHIKFYLNYEEINNNKRPELEDNNIEMKIRKISFPKMVDQQHQKVAHELSHPKKVSLNFDCFNPRKKLREDHSDKKVQIFEEIWSQDKEKYIERV